MIQLKKLAEDRYQVLDVTSKGSKLLVTAVRNKRNWKFRCEVDKLVKFDRLGELVSILKETFN